MMDKESEEIMNDWLITWRVNETDVTAEYKEERQYIADALYLLQNEILPVEGLIDVTIEPIGFDQKYAPNRR
tara:strand:- start:665 stop:880 length:216 start_codon:yes stop_codon:yes gene_type:complete